MAATDPRMVTVRGCRLYLTDHAVERYAERVKPFLTFDEAMAELVRVLPLADIGERPAWAACRQDASGWVTVADGIAFPVVRARLMTCLTRGEAGAELRVVRGKERRDRRERAARPGAKKKHGKVARDERRRARAMREAADG